jgi:SAM-dependent methyltransferase
MDIALPAGIVNSCPICSSSVHPWRTKVTSHGDFAITRCAECGYAFVNPRPTLQCLMEFYSTRGHGGPAAVSLSEIAAREAAHPNSTRDAGRIIQTTRRLVSDLSGRSPARLLDIGCGYGFFSAEAIRQGFDVTALELAETERSMARQIAGLTPIAESFESFQAASRSFHAILMSHVLEHALDVNEWVRKAGSLVAPGGVLAIALPNFGSFLRLALQEEDPYVCPPAHLNYFSARSLSLLLKRHGFNVEQIQWISRINPAVVLQRLLPRRGKSQGISLRVVDTALRGALGAADWLRLGMILNVYARKRGKPSES